MLPQLQHDDDEARNPTHSSQGSLHWDGPWAQRVQQRLLWGPSHECKGHERLLLGSLDLVDDVHFAHQLAWLPSCHGISPNDGGEHPKATLTLSFQ
jgi:hypothetical protein